MLKKILILLVICISLLLVAGLFISPEFKIEQSIVIEAKPAKIHPYVNDLKQWPKWTPWQEMEPDVVIRYGNVTRGVGANQTWSGKGGHGRIHLTASSPTNGIAYDIFFGDDTNPSISAIQYTELNSGHTRVTWRMHGEVDFPFIGPYIAIMVRMITADMYQTGLMNLKQLVEKSG